MAKLYPENAIHLGDGDYAHIENAYEVVISTSNGVEITNRATFFRNLKE